HFFFSSRRRHTRSYGDWSSDVCSSDLSSHQDHLKLASLLFACATVLLAPAAHAQTWAWDDGTVPYVQTPMEIVERMLRMAEVHRSEERRVGKECRSRWDGEQEKKREKV